MSATARLQGKLTMDDAQFHQSLRRASAALGAFSQRVAGVMKPAAMAGLTAGIVAASAAMAGLGAAIRNGLEQGGNFDDLSKRIQDTAGNAALLSKAFDLAGIGGDQLGGVINKMQKSIAAGGDVFAQLGISLQSLQGQSPTEQFKAIGDAIARIQDPVKRADAAMTIFGKSGGQLLQIFGDVGTLETARKTLGSMPDILNRSAAAMGDAGDKFDAFKGKWDAFSVGIAAGLAPTINAALGKALNFDTAALGKGLADDIAGAINGQETASAVAGLGGRLVNVMSAAATSSGAILTASLLKAFNEPLVQLQATIEAITAKIAGGMSGKEPLTSEEEARRKELGPLIEQEEAKFKGMVPNPSKMNLGGFGTPFDKQVDPYYYQRNKLVGLRQEKARLDQKAAESGMIDQPIQERAAQMKEQGGARIGFGEGMSADELTKWGMDNVGAAAQKNFPKTTAAVSNSINAFPADDSRLMNAIAMQSPLQKLTGPLGPMRSMTVQDALKSKPELSTYDKMMARALSPESKAGGYNGGSIGVKGDPGSVLRAPSRVVGGVRRRGETKQEFRDRLSGKKKDDKSLDDNTERTAVAVESMLQIWGGG